MTNKVKRIKKILVLMMAVAMLFGMVQISFAAEAMDMSQPLTLDVALSGEDKVPGMEFKIYKVASMDEYTRFTVESKFESYSIDFTGIENQDDWRTLAQTLQGYILRDAVAPDYTALTDDQGVAAFGEVERGVYLLLADRYEYQGTAYIADAAMLSVPNVDDATEEWVYNVGITAKYSTESVPPEIPETPGLEVIKLWRNEDSVTRPNGITAQLICDGAVIDEVVLNKENGWKHVWTGLEAGKTYSVTEKDVPEGYAVAISYESQIFTITNTGNTPPPPGTPPPDVPPTLPQTGVPWIPVIAVGGTGLVLFVAGLIRRNYE